MEYTQEIFDRRTGEMLTVAMGNWVTITELGEMLGAGSRETRTILRKMEFLQIEDTATKSRNRLCPWVVQKGWGKRIETNRSRPFDVVSPEGQAWVAERWQKVAEELHASKSALSVKAAAALNDYLNRRDNPLPVELQVFWLADHFPTLTQVELASITNVTQPLVNRYLRRRSARLASLRAKRDKPLEEPLDDKPRMSYRQDDSEWSEPPGGR